MTEADAEQPPCCWPCGRRFGRRDGRDGVAVTAWEGACGVCGERGAVTSPRAWGWLQQGWQDAFHSARSDIPMRAASPLETNEAPASPAEASIDASRDLPKSTGAPWL